jgi:hypothetical protein
MLVNQLRVTVATQQDTEIVKPGNNSLKLDPIDKEYRHGRLVLANIVQKNVLKVLVFVIAWHVLPLYSAWPQTQGNTGPEA